MASREHVWGLGELLSNFVPACSSTGRVDLGCGDLCTCTWVRGPWLRELGCVDLGWGDLGAWSVDAGTWVRGLGCVELCGALVWVRLTWVRGLGCVGLGCEDLGVGGWGGAFKKCKMIFKLCLFYAQEM